MSKILVDLLNSQVDAGAQAAIEAIEYGLENGLIESVDFMANPPVVSDGNPDLVAITVFFAPEKNVEVG